MVLKKFTNFLHCKLEEGKHIVTLFIDYERCFETSHHDVLIEKMSSCGIIGKSIGWFKEYLIGRENVIKINKALSEPYKVTRELRID